jgi:Fe-S-cluster-containing hydrogenase component 2
MRLVVDSPACTGCNSCALSCSFVHQGHFSLADARVTIERDSARARFVPRVCVQCEEAPCIAVCPTDALLRDEELGCIRIVEARCVKCGKCGPACPFGGVRLDGPGRVPVICDLCGGDPECVKHCRLPGALSLGAEGKARTGAQA